MTQSDSVIFAIAAVGPARPSAGRLFFR